MAQLSKQEKETDLITDLNKDFKQLEKTIAEMEFQRMFSGEMDSNNAYLDIQAGSGGTEAQDWAEMLLRMYLRWGDKHGFTTTLMEASPGEVAGIKARLSNLQAVMRMVGCVARRAYIGWSVNLLLIRAIVVILRLLRSLCHPKSMMILKLKSTRRNYVLTLIALAVREGST